MAIALYSDSVAAHWLMGFGLVARSTSDKNEWEVSFICTHMSAYVDACMHMCVRAPLYIQICAPMDAYMCAHLCARACMQVCAVTTTQVP